MRTRRARAAAPTRDRSTRRDGDSANGIRPLFVFNGMSVPRKETARPTLDLRYQKRISGWEA